MNPLNPMNPMNPLNSMNPMNPQSRFHYFAHSHNLFSFWIDVSSFCRVGDNPSATTPVTGGMSSGTYLNTNSPVNCVTENTITSWHYCYYTSQTTSGQTYTMTVGVWRLESSTNTYTLTQRSSRAVTLTHISTLAKVFCVEEMPDPVDYVFVALDDVIGVVLPANNPIPVVSFGNSTLLRHSASTLSTSRPVSEFTTATNIGLHLYSNLGKSTNQLYYRHHIRLIVLYAIACHHGYY